MNFSSDQRAQFRAAQCKEMDQWISNDVISICQRAGIPKERIMAMRWVHTWIVAEGTEETWAKARLVVKGFTNPESPTLSRLSRQLTLQTAALRGSRLRKGDVKTAFSSGDREETSRDVYAEPPQELREKLQITREQVLKLETAENGLRNTVQQQLDQCTVMFMNGVLCWSDSSESTWTIPWWPDATMIPSSRRLCENFKDQRRTCNDDNFALTGMETETLPDGGFLLRQQKFVDQLELMSLSQRRSRADTYKLTPGELTQLRGVTASANWLGNQTRPDLCVSTFSRCTCISNCG